MENLTPEQILAIKCAYADLKGALEAHEACDRLAHDWDAHELSIEDLRDQFDFLKFS